MSRQKRNSSILQLAERRLTGMKIINPKLDLGGGCTTSAVEAKVKEVKNKLENYNIQLSNADTAANELERAEKELNRLSNKVLPGVATRFDKESDEYEIVGGVKPSERRRPRRQSA